jgi:hypothetical protein
MSSIAVIDILADAVTATLKAAATSLSLSFTADQLYVPVHELDDLAGLKLTIVPTGLTGALASRGGLFTMDYVIDIGIQQRQTVNLALPGPVDPAVVRPLMYFVEQVFDLFRGKNLASDPVALCVEAANNPVYVPAHLDEMRVFTSVLSLTFRLVR